MITISSKKTHFNMLLLLLALLPTMVAPLCTLQDDTSHDDTLTQHASLKYKIVAILTIFLAGGIGVSIPQLGKKVEALNPDNDIFFMIKAFAAGVILGTGFIHILPDAFELLTSPCLDHGPWSKFPFAGFVAMSCAIGALMLDTFATSFYTKMHFNKQKSKQVVDVESSGDVVVDDHAGHVHVHAHATDGHAHGSVLTSHEYQLMRHRIISQVIMISTNFCNLVCFGIEGIKRGVFL